jgi:hypothetical protein
MASYELQKARADLTRAHAAVRSHDGECSTCNVRKHRRCATGKTMVRAFWDAQAAVDEARKVRTPSNTRQTALFSASRVR